MVVAKAQAVLVAVEVKLLPNTLAQMSIWHLAVAAAVAAVSAAQPATSAPVVLVAAVAAAVTAVPWGQNIRAITLRMPRVALAVKMPMAVMLPMVVKQVLMTGILKMTNVTPIILGAVITVNMTVVAGEPLAVTVQELVNKVSVATIKLMNSACILKC